MGKPTWLDAAWMQRGLSALRESFGNTELKPQMINFLVESGLWSQQQFDAAEARFNGCLNPSKPNKFSAAEVWALTKHFQRYQFIEALVADLGGEIHWKPTEERRLAAIERLATALEENNRIAAQARSELGDIDSTLPLRIHPALTAGGSFDKAGF